MPFAARSVLKSAAWLGFLAGCVLILGNTYLDFRPGGEGVFIEQKGEAGRQPLWLLCHSHIISSKVTPCRASVTITAERFSSSMKRACSSTGASLHACSCSAVGCCGEPIASHAVKEFECVSSTRWRVTFGTPFGAPNRSMRTSAAGPRT